MVALLTSVRNSPCFGGLRRTKTCHWQLFARPSMLFGYFLHDAKSDKPFPFREVRGFPNLESAHQNNGFARTKLKPSQRELRGSANLESAHKSNNFAQTQLNPLPLRLPPHGRLAHVRSQFSLFRRSPTHKNLPPATFLHVRATFSYFL